LVTLNSSPNVIGQAQSLATVTLENLIMNKHNLHYIDLNPAPIEEPSDLAIVAGAVALLAGLGFVLIVLFSL
jgi:hypothetical protein